MHADSARADGYRRELATGERFDFGANWRSFLTTLTEEHIREAEQSIRTMLGVDHLRGLRFLDVGSGSGLFSLAARRLGATVHSFDFDRGSVECTHSLRQRYFSTDEAWSIERGSVLDGEYVARLGTFDIVYSWGVLHHTGRMWQALELAADRVARDGVLFIALYNDQGPASRAWRTVKRTYCSGLLARGMLTAVFFPYFAARTIIKGIVQEGHPFASFRTYKKRRGMSAVHDWRDWLGGYPFEVARPEEVLDFLRARNFSLERLVTTNRSGCNQFVFRKH